MSDDADVEIPFRIDDTQPLPKGGIAHSYFDHEGTLVILVRPNLPLSTLKAILQHELMHAYMRRRQQSNRKPRLH